MNFIDNAKAIILRMFEKEKYVKKRNVIQMLINEYKSKSLNLYYGNKLPLFKTHKVTYQKSADGDEDYLGRCLNYYESHNIAAIGFIKKENDIASEIFSLLEKYQPNILVITGHDAYYKKKGSYHDLDAYKNSNNFIEAVKEARRFESSHQKLIVIAGACQSNYEELIKAGANFASSPKRINIHALDPAIIAAKMSLSDINNDIDLKDIIEHTKYGSDGVGGIITKGTMYMGYPR